MNLTGGTPDSSSTITYTQLMDSMKEHVKELESKMDRKTYSYRKLVMPEDMNHSGKLFGGRMMQWLDEAAALYAICQMRSRNVVTLKVSDILFKEPVENGDFLLFNATTNKVGNTSLTIGIEVLKKDIVNDLNITVLTCEFIFVKIDPETNLPVPHGLKK